MARLLIVIVCYSLAVFTLPGWPPFARLLQDLSRLPAQTAFIINIGALIIAGALLYALLRKPNGLIYRRPSGALEIVRTGLVGVIFATLYALFEAMSGFAITVMNLALIPPAFMAGEAAFVGSLWLWRRVSGQGKPAQAPTPNQDRPADSNETRLPRLLITMPVYVFVLVYLPQQQDFRTLEAKLINVSPSIGLMISIAALIGAAAVGILYLKQANKKPLPQTSDPFAEAKYLHFQHVKRTLVLTFAIGLGVAATINIVGYFVNYAPSLALLIIMPFAFTVAEALYEGLSWRLKYGPPEV